MHRKMMLEDDIKEYWGFHLLRGSVVRLSVCSRHEGASFIIVRGLEDAKRCAFLGELDSQEVESESNSDEFEFQHEFKDEAGIGSEASTSSLEHDEDAPSSLERLLQGLSKQKLVDRYLRVIAMRQNVSGGILQFPS